MVIHMLLHLPHSKTEFGPPSGYWSYVMERFVGILGPMVHNRRFPDANLARAAEISSRLRCLCLRKAV